MLTLQVTKNSANIHVIGVFDEYLRYSTSFQEKKTDLSPKMDWPQTEPTANGNPAQHVWKFKRINT
uniref:Uncharacterized protein n=1 Tax=Anguilla anguilla TaxID=7936 RepID=A0A0E9WFZ1_ANGAN